MADFVEMIQKEFSLRASRNSQYSWSAFARDLGVTPARLHSIVARKSGLSAAAAGKIAKKMGCTEAEAQRFCALVESRHARSTKQRAAARAKVNVLSEQLQVRDGKDLNGISSWYHLALMELIALPGFRNDERWIADRLG